MREADWKERRVEEDSSEVGQRRSGAAETVLMKGPGSSSLPGPHLLGANASQDCLNGCPAFASP